MKLCSVRQRSCRSTNCILWYKLLSKLPQLYLMIVWNYAQDVTVYSNNICRSNRRRAINKLYHIFFFLYMSSILSNYFKPKPFCFSPFGYTIHPDRLEVWKHCADSSAANVKNAECFCSLVYKRVFVEISNSRTTIKVVW